MTDADLYNYSLKLMSVSCILFLKSYQSALDFIQGT